MGKRRKARELVMQFLYQHDFARENSEEALDLFFEDQKIDEETNVFSRDLIKGTLSKKEDIDKLITKYADNWEIARIAAVDRNILRMAIYEMLYLDDIPTIVSINEAVDIAKKYSTGESGKFVNGILDKIKQEIVDKNGKKPS